MREDTEMAYGEVARGLSDIKIYKLSGATDTPATAIDWPGARALEFQAEQDTEEWEGDDTVIAISSDNKRGSGSLAVGRQNPTALAAVLGGTTTISGTTPNAIAVYDETGDPNATYVAIVGQSRGVNTSGAAYRVTLAKCKVASPSESLAQKAYNEPSMDLQFIPDAAGKFIRRQWFETLAAVPAALTYV
jgi:hypothetical protein